MEKPIEIIPLKHAPIFTSEVELWQYLMASLKENARNGDILVCAHTPFSRVLGHCFSVDQFVPSGLANKLAAQTNKDPRKVEAIIQHSTKIVKVGRNVIIADNYAGVTCANAGIDESNAGIGKIVVVPPDPDGLAWTVKQKIKEELDLDVAVIISDTVGRALRRHAANIAIGVAGMKPTRSYIGRKDLFGYEMKVSIIALADELASAAELAQGESSEGIPFVLIRNVQYEPVDVPIPEYSARNLNRPEEERLFR